MKLTEKARADLEAYLRDVRAALEGDPGVDPDHVVEGIREHVEAALNRQGDEPGTAEGLADVLERLGIPGQWAASGEVPSAGSIDATHDPAGRSDPPALLRPEVVPLVLAGIGTVLVLAELAVPLGWGLIVMGAVTARVVLHAPGVQSRRDAPAGVLVSLLWHFSAIVAAGALVLLPALLVWGQSQTGGVLEPLILDRILPPGGSLIPGDRPGGYWPLVGLLSGTATGVWWIALALLGRWAARGVRRALGNASYLVSGPVLRGLLVGGGILLILSLLFLLGRVV